MRLHLVALPHTRVSAEFCGCAYTSKALKFCKMFATANPSVGGTGGNHEVLLYAPEGPEVPGAMALVPCLWEEQRISTFGADDPNRLPSWPSDEQTAVFNQNVIAALRSRLQPRDLILLTGGWTHKPIADAFPNHISCEPGVGYEGILGGARQFCAFESYAWMHHVYAKKGISDGRWFDCVIPNYFDPEDFLTTNEHELTRITDGKEYLLFLGRLVARKGPHIAAEIARAAGLPLVVAGPGGKQVGNDIVAPEITIKNARYVGPVNVKERAELLAGARALIVPTTYIEPFGGVAVEAMMCGTPVITTDWGAFTETAIQGFSGFRFHTLREAVACVKLVDQLDRQAIRDWAIDTYSIDDVRPKFEAWFSGLNSLWDEGWYQ